MTTVFQASVRQIEIFKGSYLPIFYNNFSVTQDLHKNSIHGEAMQPLCRIAILYEVHNIEVQAHQISTKQNSLAEVLSCGQYTKIANKYLFLQIALSIFGILLKAIIQKYLLNECKLNYSGMDLYLVHKKYIQKEETAIQNTAHYLEREYFLHKQENQQYRLAT